MGGLEQLGVADPTFNGHGAQERAIGTVKTDFEGVIIDDVHFSQSTVRSKASPPVVIWAVRINVFIVLDIFPGEAHVLCGHWLTV